MASAFRGVFTIPVTPFDEAGELDERSLLREVDWCVRAGAHGVVAPVNASEGPALTDAERERVTRLVVEGVERRVPVVIGVSGVSRQASLLYTAWAREAGADAVIAMPPYGARLAGFDEVYAFYRAVADAAGDLPVFVQNWAGPAGTPMTAGQVARLLRDIPNVSYVKEESSDAGHAMTAELAGAGSACLGVMGGMGGRHLLGEHRRGSCGTMPACQTTDVHAAIWNALEAGDESGARAMHTRLAPLLNLEDRYGVPLYKEVLQWRGVIDSATVRGYLYSPLDAYDREELNVVLRDIEELFTV
ncbi:MAG TPA: dihydrodipicolinate synthase family protein [Thermomicrobiaceae bacterium]|nr:dihydrodipicolinate synthase family protein [Thermomicrobiaceae bacterium]